MDLDFSPRLTLRGTAAELQCAYASPGFEFAGPGWYLSKTAVALVVPESAPSIDVAFSRRWPANARFTLYEWPTRADICGMFNAFVNAPVRNDNR